MWISFNQSIWKGGEGEIVVSSMENRSYRPPTVSGLLSITFVTIYTAKCLKIHFSHQFVFLLSSPFLSRFIQLPLLLWLLCIMLRHSLHSFVNVRSVCECHWKSGNMTNFFPSNTPWYNFNKRRKFIRFPLSLQCHVSFTNGYNCHKCCC